MFAILYRVSAGLAGERGAAGRAAVRAEHERVRAGSSGVLDVLGTSWLVKLASTPAGGARGSSAEATLDSNLNSVAKLRKIVLPAGVLVRLASRSEPSYRDPSIMRAQPIVCSFFFSRASRQLSCDVRGAWLLTGA